MRTIVPVLNVAVGVLALLLTCGQRPSEGKQSRKPGGKGKAAAKRIVRTAKVSEERVLSAVLQARERTKTVDADKDPRDFVAEFESVLRPYVELETGIRMSPLMIDSRPSALPMYETYAKMLKQREDTSTYVGDPKKGAERVEVVSLAPAGDQCTGIAIARNAIVTAEHCTQGALTFFRIGETATSGKQVFIDASGFVPVEKLHGTKLDMAILVLETDIAELTDDQLPVFAPATLIDAATVLQIVGYGGAVNDHSEGGTKRLGSVPMLDADCDGTDVPSDFKCTPGFEMVAGARPIADRVSCPASDAPTIQQGACKGDSGGPVYVSTTDQRLLLAGIIRSAIDPLKCGCAEATNVYVRLDKQLDAICGVAGIRFHPKAFSEIDPPPACQALLARAEPRPQFGRSPTPPPRPRTAR